MRLLATLFAVSLGACGASAPPPTPQAPEWTTGKWKRVCKFDTGVLGEISGLAASVRHPGVLWAVNDSGNAPDLIAVDAATCAVRGQVRVNAPNTDWEALAMGSRGGKPVLFIGDIGDNLAARDSVSVLEVPEPDLTAATASARVHSFRYPGGSVDAEGLMARGTQVWVVSKQLRGSVFRIRLKQGGVQRMGGAPAYATDAAIAPDTDVFAIRDYPTLTRYRGLPPGVRLGRSNPPQQPQAEAVTFSADGAWLYTASESDGRLFRSPVTP